MAKITIEELSGSLKEYLNGLGLTEDQVQELIDKFEDEKIGDISQLSTEEKGSLVGAINELFQSANNGKELIASAIGEPLDSNDTFSAMSNDINSLLSTFKTNMMNNGITVESNDKFKSLIDKIATMVEEGEGKGIQYASGTVKPYTTSEKYFPIYLSFEPNIIIIQGVYKNYSGGNYRNYILYNSDVLDGVNVIYAYTHSTNSGDVGVLSGRFEKNDDSYYIYIPNTSIISTIETYTYYAIGVGEEDTTLRDSLASILEEEGVSVTEEDDMASLISKVDEEFTNDNNTISELNNQITDLNNELAGKVTPAGDATAADVIAGKTFINSTGQLITGTGDLTRMLTTGSQTITVSTSSPPEYAFKKTVNHSFGAVPSNIVIITSNVVLTTESTTRFTAYNLVLKNGTTAIPYKTVYSSATNRYGGISITNITETTFDISVNAAYWATSDNATCTIKVANIIYY